MVGQQFPMLPRQTEEEQEDPCPQKSKQLRKLFKSLPRRPSHVEPTQQARLLRIYRSLRYGDFRTGNQPLQPVRLQSQNPRCLHDYHQDRTLILQQTHRHLRLTTALLRNNNPLKTHISIKEPWDGLGKLVSLSLALA